jgi:tRNA threonylcarbamoyladenosine biosynthesis protein TsaB
VEEALAKAGFAITDLEAIAIATGPGSFTGLRIGMAFAKGLALARRIALVGIPSLDVLAAGQPLKQLPMAAVLRAGRGRLAVGWYQAGKKNWEATGRLDVFTAESLAEQLNEPTLVCGELAVEERRTLRRNRRHVILASPAWSVRRPAFLAELAWVRWQAGRTDDPTSLSPIYLHYNDPIAS